VLAYAYVRRTTAHSAEAQRAAIQEAFASNLASAGYEELVFCEEVDYANVWLRSRPVGFRLSLGLRTRDIVLIAHGSVAFADVTDFLQTCRAWITRKVRILILDSGLDLNPANPDACVVLFHYLGITEQLRHERACERATMTTAAKRAAGKLLSRHAPPGFKIVGPRRRRHLVPITTGPRRSASLPSSQASPPNLESATGHAVG
jgi:hypothetical protein